MHILDVQLKKRRVKRGLLAHGTSGTVTAEAEDLVAVLKGISQLLRMILIPGLTQHLDLPDTMASHTYTLATNTS